MKHAVTASACAAALVMGLAACGSAGDKGATPAYPGGSSASPTATITPTTTAPAKPKPRPSGRRPGSQPAHSTYTYGGLKMTVNLPANLPRTSDPGMDVFSVFLQAVGRTTAQEKVDPVLSDIATPKIVEYFQTSMDPEFVRTIGSMTFTVSKVHSDKTHITDISGCFDQSKLIMVRKDGSQYIDPDPEDPTLKMSATVDPERGPQVPYFTFGAGPC